MYCADLVSESFSFETRVLLELAICELASSTDPQHPTEVAPQTLLINEDLQLGRHNILRFQIGRNF